MSMRYNPAQAQIDAASQAISATRKFLQDFQAQRQTQVDTSAPQQPAGQLPADVLPAHVAMQLQAQIYALNMQVQSLSQRMMFSSGQTSYPMPAASFPFSAGMPVSYGSGGTPNMMPAANMPYFGPTQGGLPLPYGSPTTGNSPANAIMPLLAMMMLSSQQGQSGNSGNTLPLFNALLELLQQHTTNDNEDQDTSPAENKALTTLQSYILKNNDETDADDPDQDGAIVSSVDITEIQVGLDMDKFTKTDLVKAFQHMIVENPATQHDELHDLLGQVHTKGWVHRGDVLSETFLKSLSSEKQQKAAQFAVNQGFIDDKGQVNRPMIEFMTSHLFGLNQTKQDFSRAMLRSLVKTTFVDPGDAVEKDQLRNFLKLQGFKFDADGQTLKPDSEQPFALHEDDAEASA